MVWRLLSCIENQFTRRNLSKYDRGVLALQLEEMYAAEAKKRQGTRTDLVKNSAPCPDAGKTRDKVAAIAGISHDTLRKVKVIETDIGLYKISSTQVTVLYYIPITDNRREL